MILILHLSYLLIHLCKKCGSNVGRKKFVFFTLAKTNLDFDAGDEIICGRYTKIITSSLNVGLSVYQSYVI